jgi:Fe2+ transport system protein FeoA
MDITVMEYNGLITAIPASWKRAVKKMRIPEQAISNQEQPYVTCNNRLMALGIVTNKDVYWELVTKKQIKPNCADK